MLRCAPGYWKGRDPNIPHKFLRTWELFNSAPFVAPKVAPRRNAPECDVLPIPTSSISAGWLAILYIRIYSN